MRSDWHIWQVCEAPGAFVPIVYEEYVGCVRGLTAALTFCRSRPSSRFRVQEHYGSVRLNENGMRSATAKDET